MNSPKSSERIKVRCATMIVRPISIDSLFFIDSRTFEKRTPMNRPNMIHPVTILVNERNQRVNEVPVSSPESMIPSITRKSARAVPSLNILSPSKISASLRGAPTLLKIDKTATGSVADIREPNKRHTRKGICNPKNGNIKNKETPIISADIESQITARVPIDFQFLSNCL